jgi:hypothetical protein
MSVRTSLVASVVGKLCVGALIVLLNASDQELCGARDSLAGIVWV